MFKSGAFLPTSWQPGWYVEAIDASCSDLVYEAFNNMRNLVFLKSLDVSYCPQMDDWCLDRISGEFQDSLEELDVSGCSMVGLSGLEVRICPLLKKMFTSDPTSEEKPFSCTLCGKRFSILSS